MYVTDFLGIILASTLYISMASATITLSQFQTVTGFPSACQNAYNTPIAGCDASDFPQKCSSECFYALTQAEALIDNACVGQQAPFNSIIGQMFEGNGPDFMCTSDFSLGSSGETSSTSYNTDATSSSPSTTTASTSTKRTSSVTVTMTTETESKSKAKSIITTSSAVRRTSTDAKLTSTATSSSSSSTSTLSPSSTNTPPSRSSATFLTTAFVNGQATTLTSQAQRTSAANSNPDAFGGGGSPFEVGANGNGGEKAGADFWLLLSVVFGVVLMS